DLRALLLAGEDEAIDVAAEAQRIEPEHPLVAPGDRGRRSETVDARRLDRARVDVLDPARGQIFGEALLGRHLHHVEAKRLAAAFVDAEHGLRRVVEGKSAGREEREAEPRMHEAAAAHEALAR